MAFPISLSEFRALLEAKGFRPSKSRGQNFLHDPNLREAIAAAARLDAGDRVLEIGTGCGYLTEAIARRAGRVLTVEIDPRLSEIARELLPGRANVEFFVGDFLKGKTIAPEIAARLAGFAPSAVVANLPYSVAGSALGSLSLSRPPIRRMVVTVQKEVAERVVAPPGSPERGPLTLCAQLYYEAELLRRVPPDVFWPRPRVDSAVLALERAREPLPERIEAAYLRLVGILFRQKRKQVGRALRGELSQLAGAAGLDPRKRPQDLTVGEFLFLAEKATLLPC